MIMESGSSKICKGSAAEGLETQKDPMFQFKSEMVNLIYQPDWAKGLLIIGWKAFLMCL